MFLSDLLKLSVCTQSQNNNNCIFINKKTSNCTFPIFFELLFHCIWKLLKKVFLSKMAFLRRNTSLVKRFENTFFSKNTNFDENDLFLGYFWNIFKVISVVNEWPRCIRCRLCKYWLHQDDTRGSKSYAFTLFLAN